MSKRWFGASFVGSSTYQALCSQLIKGVCLRVLGVCSYVVACAHVHTCGCMFSCTYMHEEAGGGQWVSSRTTFPLQFLRKGLLLRGCLCITRKGRRFYNFNKEKHSASCL